MEKKVDKIFKYSILIFLVLIGILYWFGAIAMHYIYGFISLFLLLFLYVFSNIEKKIFKKQSLIAFIISLFVLISVVITHFSICNHPFSFQYKKYDDGIMITGYTDKIINEHNEYYVEIPTNIKGKPVKAIGEKAFMGSDDVYILILPDTIELIEKEAFFASNISSLSLSSNLKCIETRAFANINITHLTIPSSVRYIGEDAFNLGTIFAIQTNNFIDEWDENWNSSVHSKIYYNSIEVKNIDGIIYVLHNDKTATVSTILKSDKTMIILDKINFNNEDYIVDAIDVGAGYANWFEEITIPNTIVTIKDNAFGMNNNLKSIYIPKSVIYMGNNIFKGSLNVIINTEFQEEPETWSEYWNIENRKVNWNEN